MFSIKNSNSNNNNNNTKENRDNYIINNKPQFKRKDEKANYFKFNPFKQINDNIKSEDTIGYFQRLQYEANNVKPIKFDEISFDNLIIKSQESFNIDLFTCNICCSIMHSPLQCVNGHLICSNPCWNNILKSASPSCPVCRVNVQSSFSLGRNQIYNDMFSKLKFNCYFKSNGCDLIDNYENFKNHFEKCKYKSVVCLLCKEEFMESITDVHFELCEMVVGNCDKCSIEMTRKQFLNHQCEKHIIKFCETCGFGLNSTNQHKHQHHQHHQSLQSSQQSQQPSDECILSKFILNLLASKNEGLLDKSETDKIQNIKNQILSLSDKSNLFPIQHFIKNNNSFDLFLNPPTNDDNSNKNNSNISNNPFAPPVRDISINIIDSPFSTVFSSSSRDNNNSNSNSNINNPFTPPSFSIGRRVHTAVSSSPSRNLFSLGRHSRFDSNNTNSIFNQTPIPDFNNSFNNNNNNNNNNSSTNNPFAPPDAFNNLNLSNSPFKKPQ